MAKGLKEVFALVFGSVGAVDRARILENWGALREDLVEFLTTLALAIRRQGDWGLNPTTESVQALIRAAIRAIPIRPENPDRPQRAFRGRQSGRRARTAGRFNPALGRRSPRLRLRRVDGRGHRVNPTPSTSTATDTPDIIFIDKSKPAPDVITIFSSGEEREEEAEDTDEGSVCLVSPPPRRGPPPPPPPPPPAASAPLACH